jgi:hypothetical protein
VKIGQKVICIDDAPPSAANGSDYCLIRPIAGEIYTIRGIHIEPGIEGYGLYLEECLNPSVIWSDNTEVEWPFSSTRFKLLDRIGSGHNADREWRDEARKILDEM